MVSRSTSVFVYIGSGDEGTKMEELIKREAKRRGYVRRSGDANVSPFIIHCIKYTIEHEKVK